MSKNRSLNSQIIHVYVSEQIKRTHNIYLKLMQLLFGFIVDWFPFVISLLIQTGFCDCSIFLSIYLYSHHLNVFDVLKMEFMLKLAEFKYPYHLNSYAKTPQKIADWIFYGEFSSWKKTLKKSIERIKSIKYAFYLKANKLINYSWLHFIYRFIVWLLTIGNSKCMEHAERCTLDCCCFVNSPPNTNNIYLTLVGTLSFIDFWPI